jgi:hypothetical protein
VDPGGLAAFFDIGTAWFEDVSLKTDAEEVIFRSLGSAPV